MFKEYILLLKKVFFSKKIISILFLLIVPFCYVFFYVGLYKDPQNSTQNFKVGVVNLDKKVNDEEFGKKFSNNLKNNKTIKWITYDSLNQAQNDLNSYDNIYQIIVIPKNFTKTINDIKTNYTTKKLDLKIYQNPKKNGYISTVSAALKNKIMGAMQEQLLKTLEEKFLPKSKHLVENKNKILVNVDKLNDGLNLINNTFKNKESNLRNIENKTLNLENNFKNSIFYQKFPFYYNNFVNNFELYKNNYFELSKNMYDDAKIQIQTDFNLFINDFNKDLKVKNLENSNISDLMNIISDANNLLKSFKNIKTSDFENTTIYKHLNNNSNLDIINKVINNSKILNQDKKLKLTNFNNRIKAYKKHLLSILKLNLVIVNNLQSKTTIFQNQIQNSNLSKLLNIFYDDKNSIYYLENLIKNNTLKTLYKQINSDILDLITSSNNTVKNSKEIENTLNLLLGGINFNYINSNSNDFIENKIRPIKIEVIDENKPQIFGTIFLPLTLAIGLWFVLIFYFSGSTKIGDYKKNFIIKYLFNLTMSMFFAILTALIILIVANIYNIKIYDIWLYIWICIVFVFSLFNLFIYFYNYFNTYARYILTIFMVFNITASGSTYVISTLETPFRIINQFTHFKYFVNSLREILSFKQNNTVIYNNLNILLIFSFVFLFLNLVTKIIIIMISKNKISKN